MRVQVEHVLLATNVLDGNDPMLKDEIAPRNLTVLAETRKRQKHLVWFLLFVGFLPLQKLERSFSRLHGWVQHSFRDGFLMSVLLEQLQAVAKLLG